MCILSIVKTMCLQGLIGILVNVEVDVSNGMPCWDIVGLADITIKESKERIRTAIKNCNIELLSKKYIINLSPANIRKDGANFDLAIAVGILSSIGRIRKQNMEDTIFVGELSLDGKINKINGILPLCIECYKQKIKKVIVPKENTKEAAIVKDLEVIGVSNLSEVIDYLNGNLKIKREESLEVYENASFDYSKFDFSEVKGHEKAKRALEIVAAGGHNCLMIRFSWKW